MSTPYLGQIQTFAFGFAPSGWALCNGQLLSITQNQALFALLGTMYGGNGQTTFALPNLQGSCAMSFNGNPYVQGATGGEATHTLLTTEMPAHTHTQVASAATGSVVSPVNNYPAAVSANPYVGAATSTTTLGSGSSSAGGGQPHSNQSPFLVLNFCIALSGIFPSRN